MSQRNDVRIASIVKLRYEDKLSFNKIASKIGMSPQNVRFKCIVWELAEYKKRFGSLGVIAK